MDMNQPATARTTWDKIRLGLEIAVVVLWIVFLLQNTEQVQVSFLWLTFATSRIVLLLGTLCIGALVGALLTYRLCRRKAKTRPADPLP